MRKNVVFCISAVLVLLTVMLVGCDTDSGVLPPDTSGNGENPSSADPAQIRFIFADGSEEHPYETLGMESDPEQTYDKDAAFLGVWNKPKNNPMIIRDLPDDLNTYVYFDMDVYFNKPLENGMRLYIFCGKDASGEETYFYRDFYSADENWVTVSVALNTMFKHGEPDMANAERMELRINEMDAGLRQLYVRSLSVRQYYDGDAPVDYGEPTDDFERIISRYAYLEFGNGSNLNEKAHSTILKTINTECKTWMERVNRDCETDPFGMNYDFTSDNMATIYKKMYAMAQGYATPGSDYYQDPELKDKLIYCLDFMYDKYFGGTKSKVPAGSNWHHSIVEVPQSLTQILMALRNDLSMEQIAHYTDYLNVIEKDPVYTDAESNSLIEQSFWSILSAALLKDSDRLETAVHMLSETAFAYVKSGNGIYEDGSYIWHNSVPYTTGYGGALLDSLSYIVYIVTDTEYAFSSELVNRQVDWIFNAFEPVLWRGAAMSATSGRIVWTETNESSRAVGIITGMARIAQYVPEDRADAIKSLLKYYLHANSFAFASGGLLSTADFLLEIEHDVEIVMAEEKVSAKIFPTMARVTTHRKGFASMLALSSQTISRYEGFVWDSWLENCTAWYTGSGMLYVYADDVSQYDFTYHRNVNRYRLPGTTVDTRTRNPENNAGLYNRYAFVGGAQLDSHVVVGYKYDNRNSDFQSDLKAQKSYFFFDDEYVMLGSSITSTLDKGVITTVENQKAAGKQLYLNDDANAVQYAEDTPVSGVKYATLTGYGSVIFPNEQNVNVHIADNSGEKFAEIWIDHGVNPTDDTYSYILLPLAEREAAKAYYANPDVEILSNTEEVHAVREKTLGITGIVFWEAVEFGGIQPDFPCTMMVKETEQGVEIGVSDPTMKVKGEHTIVLNGVYALDGESDGVSVTTDGEKTTVTVNLSGVQGQTVSFRLKK